MFCCSRNFLKVSTRACSAVSASFLLQTCFYFHTDCHKVLRGSANVGHVKGSGNQPWGGTIKILTKQYSRLENLCTDIIELPWLHVTDRKFISFRTLLNKFVHKKLQSWSSHHETCSQPWLSLLPLARGCDLCQKQKSNPLSWQAPCLTTWVLVAESPAFLYGFNGFKTREATLKYQTEKQHHWRGSQEYRGKFIIHLAFSTTLRGRCPTFKVSWNP